MDLWDRDGRRGVKLYAVSYTHLAGRGHGAEHDHGGAAQHGFGHGLQHAGDGGEQAQQDQHAGDPHADVAAGDAGQLDDAVVLGEDRAGEGVEDAGQQRVGAVDQHAALDALHPQRAFDRLLGDLAGGEMCIRDRP